MRTIWPSSSELTKAVLEVLVKLGGSATVEQLDNISHRNQTEAYRDLATALIA